MNIDQPDNELDPGLVPIPTETDIKPEEESQLIPLPIDHSIDESATNDNNTNNDNIDNDTDMKDNTNDNTNNDDTVPQPQEQQQEITEEVIEEEEEEGGIMEEEEEESGDIIAPPPQPQTNNTNQNTNTNNTISNNNNNVSIPVKKENDDKDRARSHPITTNQQEGPRYLNIHLMNQWSNGEILQWLTHRFGLWGQQYVPVFSNKKIDGSQLIELTEDILKQEYKVTKPLHLVRICRDISDAKRSLHQINQLITPCYIDGGNAASKLMRFGPKEVYAFSTRIPLLKLHAQTFLDRQINGRVLLECTDVQLVTAMKNENITLIDAQSILDFVTKIKKENTITDKNSNDYLPVQAIYDVWNEMCKINEIRFKLLPQHIRDYSKPAPTYYPPPQHPNYGYGQGSFSGGQQGGQYGARGDGHVSEESGSPPLYETKDVREWNTEDCINWLGQIKESKVDLRVRYTPHFEQIRMNGKILLNMTPQTLSSICCITTKTHLKQLVKAIDKIRDHLVFNGFGQEPYVKEFTQKYGGAGYNMPTQRYHQTYSNEQYERSQRYEQQQREKRDAQMSQNQSQNSQTQQVSAQTEQGKESQDDGSVAKCYVCGKTGNVMRCSQCKSAFYCSRDHQVSDWPRHSKECQK